MEQKIEISLVVEDQEFIPQYSSEGASGADVRACIEEEISLAPGAIALIPTGLRFVIPSGYEIQVRPRSGLALNAQVTVLNTPGTIDSDYRGELKVILINHGKESFLVKRGMRIAQIVVCPVYKAEFIVENTNRLSITLRGEGGFGHTGTH